MHRHELVQELLRRFLEEHPASTDDLNNHAPLAKEDRQRFIELVDFARRLQATHPIFESAYQYLVHLVVLRGSRASALAVLDRRLEAAVAGRGSLILIEGVSGIGKTSLAMALEIRAHELRAAFLVSRCNEQGTTPFWLWQDVVRNAGKLTGISSDHLPAPFGEGTQARSIQHVIQSVTDWLIGCSALQPLVILLDDLHWADGDSLEVLNELTNQMVSHSILVMGTHRSEETHRGHPLYDYFPRLRRNSAVDTLQLHPLTKTDTTQLITAYHGPCHPKLSEYLYHRAEGHPLFTVELLQSLADQRLLSQDADGAWLPPDQSVPVPTLLKQVILQRVTRLGKAAETILLLAAVVGETWSLDIVEHLADLPEQVLLSGLENALKADLARAANEQDEVYQFSHGLIREVLYTEQLARRRKRLHEKIGSYLENHKSSGAARLAHHFYAAENWEKALQFYVEAGEQAAKSFANNRAIDMYQKALDAAQRGELAIDSRIQMDIYERLGRTYRVLDLQVEAEAAFSRMLDVARSTGDLESAGSALVSLTHVLVARYQLEKAEKTAQEALKVAEQLGHPQLLAQAHGSVGKILLIRGRLDASMYHLNQHRHHGEVLKDFATQSDTFRQKAFVAVWAGKYEDAEALAVECLDYGLKSGSLLYISGGYQILSASQIESGKYVEAYNNIRLILDQTEASDPYHHNLTRLLNQMGFLFLELGDATQALMWDQRALEASQPARGTSRFEMRRYSLLNVATDLLHLGRVDEALEYALRFEAMKDAPDYAHFRYQNRYLLLMSKLRLAQSKYAQAIEFAQQARSLAQSYGAQKNIAKSHWFEGEALLEVRQRAEAVRQLQQAVAIVDDIQHGSLRWKIRLSLAKALIAVRDSPDEEIQKARVLIAQTNLRLAHSPLRESFGESSWLVQFNELSGTRSPEKPSYPAGLTQREVEVLRLVASGATNQQIADALTISARTVNTHITNILNKTSCENRTAASAFAVKHNLLST